MDERFDEIVKVYKARCAPEHVEVLNQAAAAFIQRCLRDPVLVQVSLLDLKQCERGSRDRLLVGAKHSAEVLQFARGARPAVMDVVIDGRLHAAFQPQIRCGSFIARCTQGES